jgi:hypothetical protein
VFRDGGAQQRAIGVLVQCSSSVVAERFAGSRVELRGDPPLERANLSVGGSAKIARKAADASRHVHRSAAEMSSRADAAIRPGCAASH